MESLTSGQKAHQENFSHCGERGGMFQHWDILLRIKSGFIAISIIEPYVGGKALKTKFGEFIWDC